MKVYFCN